MYGMYIYLLIYHKKSTIQVGKYAIVPWIGHGVWTNSMGTGTCRLTPTGSASWDPQNHGELGSQGSFIPWNWQPKLMFGRTTRWKTNILNFKNRGLVKMNLLLAKNAYFHGHSVLVSGNFIGVMLRFLPGHDQKPPNIPPLVPDWEN